MMDWDLEGLSDCLWVGRPYGDVLCVFHFGATLGSKLTSQAGSEEVDFDPIECGLKMEDIHCPLPVETGE